MGVLKERGRERMEGKEERGGSGKKGMRKECKKEKKERRKSIYKDLFIPVMKCSHCFPRDMSITRCLRRDKVS